MKRYVVLSVLISVLSAAYGQEICNNGKDDDGDGFIDCYDKDCAVSTFCKDFYLGDEATCEAIPPAFPKFSMSLDFGSPDQTTNHLARMAIGDLDRDGIPEIVTMNKYTKKLFILNGSNGSIKHQRTVDWEPGYEVAIANIDNDNCGEIFFFGYDDPPGDNNAGNYLFAYDCNLNFLWRTEQRFYDDPINYGVADFDGDGQVEIYVKDEIYDAHTGTRIVKTKATSGDSWRRINGGPVAADIVGDENLELIIGCAIYSVDLGNRTKDAGSLTLVKKVSNYYIRNMYNATSVADYNQDGYLDVLASGSLNSNGDNTTVFFWDVHNDVVKTYSHPIPGTFTIFACPDQTGKFYEDGWKNGTGRLNIGDLDGNGKLDVAYVSGKFLYALDENFNPLSWSPLEVNEETSGHTGCTLFDFNGDGVSEIVYRDERFLYIINGTDGSIHTQEPCVSRTNREYPIVADVDADGSTELCVTCGTDDAKSIANFCTLSYSRYSQVRVYSSGGDPWVPARRVWNQHGYFNVNINDDLTVPKRQQKHHLVFSSGSCTSGPHRPLNTFLNQAPFLNMDGCPTYKSPDVSYVDNSLSVNPPTCPNQNFTVSFEITNQGDISVSGSVPITFYNGDPTQPGAIKLNTVTIPIGNLGVGEVRQVNDITVSGPGGPFTLYIVLNDAGTSPTTPITMPNTNLLECDYNDNIIFASITPLPMALSAIKLQDNIKCVGSNTPNNGAARAFVPGPGGTENTTDYNFYWSIGNVVKPIPADYTGSAIGQLAEGTYTVIARHKTAQCMSEEAQVTIGRMNRSVTVDIVLMHPYDNCETPNGSLKAIVNDDDGDGVGENPTLFDYTWYEGVDIFTKPEISISQIPTGLKPITYTVLVTDRNTGCQSINSRAVPDHTFKPSVSASAEDIVCSSAQSGKVSAHVEGSTSGFTFEWYRGPNVKPMADFTGPNHDNLSAGSYTVVVTHDGSDCAAEPVTVTINQTTNPTVTASRVANMTSCDPALPNGSVSASPVGGTSTYSFEWFSGQNTLPASRIATTATASDLPAGIYTVKMTDDATGCFDTDEVTVDFAVVTPVLNVSAVGHQTNCTTPDGSITADVTPDSPGDYTFYWYEGTSVKATPDFADHDHVLNGVTAGTYTVQAIHNTKHCITASVQVTVLDNTPAIDIIQNNSVQKLPTNCKESDGVMEVQVTAAGNTLGFVIEWFRGPDTTPFSTETGVNVSRQNGLSSSVYHVKATNLNNGCFTTADFLLPFAEAQELTFVSKTDAASCFPENEGSITVRLKPTPAPNPPNGFTTADYDLFLYQGKNTAGPLVAGPIEGSTGTANGDGTSNYAFGTLTPGFYTVVAVEDHPQLSGCESMPVVVEILPFGANPSISSVSTPANNSNCTGATPNGSITLSIDGGANPADYNYAWFEGKDLTAPVLGTNTPGTTVAPGNIAQQLPGGTYTVQVENQVTHCTSVATFVLFNNPPTVSLPAAGLDLTDVTLCSAPNGGAATVAVLNEGSTPGNLANYTFAWFDGGQNPLPDAGNPNTTNSITGLSAGIYYMRATKTAGTSGIGCSTQVEFEIIDRTIGTTGVQLADFIQPTRCLKPGNVLGELTALATGTSTNGYTYNWYAGSTATGTVISNNPALTGISIPPGQTEVTYTVEVINNQNDCVVTDTYVLPLAVEPVTISASSSPLTFCKSNNGTIFATVTNDFSLDYEYAWYVGNAPKAVADYSGKKVTDLPVGEYTIVATDLQDSFCASIPVTVTIIDARTFPVLTATAVSPLTICDPARPDGSAAASVNGDIVNFTFDWYKGAPVGTPVYSGAEVSQLEATTYSVIGSHIVTGCSDTAQVTILQNFKPVSIPQVVVQSDVTSCVTDNGILSASVGGNTGDYIFHWYDRHPGTPTDTATAVLKGTVYPDLKEGTYFVSATSRHTGCISAPATGIIKNAQVYPDFAFQIKPASCEGADGFISIFMLNQADIESIIWDGSLVRGPNLQNIPAGTYSVTVTSAMGCVTTREAELVTEVRPFNGISRNGDGQNEIFHINCIGDFPNNTVRIYNRAGTLVYEAQGYNNIDIYFDGRANKGINIMGNNLPDGTYFFMIDKGNGTKPVAGFLEIVN